MFLRLNNGQAGLLTRDGAGAGVNEHDCGAIDYG